MAFTDDDLKRLKNAEESNAKRIESMGGEGSIVLTRLQADRFIARLEAAEKVCKLSQLEQASHFTEGMGWESTERVYEALKEWRKAAGKG